MEEKAAKEEKKRAARDEKRKSQALASTVLPAPVPTAADALIHPKESTEVHLPPTVENSGVSEKVKIGHSASTDPITSMEMQLQERSEDVSTAKSEPSPTNKSMKGWFGRLRRKSKSQRPDGQDTASETFTGGTALTGVGSSSSPDPHTSAKETTAPEPAAIGAVANETREDATDKEERAGRSKHRRFSITSLSVRESSREDEFQEARDNFEDITLSPAALETGADVKSSSPARTSQFTEVI
jgi:hypothetical protein